MAARTSRHLVPNWAMPSEKRISKAYPEVPTPYRTLEDNDIKVFDIEVNMARSLITSNPNKRPKHFANLFEECVFVFTIMMAIASTTFLQGVIVINTATIGRDLIMSPAEVAWIAASIGLSSGSFVLFFGKTADLFGRKIQLLLGMVLLSLFSLVTSFVPSPIAMNITCGLLGFGTAIINPPAIGVLLATYPEGRRRNRVTGALGAGNPIGFILGSISSGFATKYHSWRSSFLVIAIFFLIMTTFVVWTVPSIPRTGNRSEIARNFDYFGTFLMIVGMALVSASLTEGPEIGWTSFKVVLMLICGVFCVVGFSIWETIFPYPLLNPMVWANKTFTLVVLSVSIGYMSFITNEFWIALYMQDIQIYAPLHIAVLLLPQAVAGIFWSYLGQALISRISGTAIMAIGGFGYLVGAVLLIFIKQNSSYWMFLFPALCITVIGADFQFIVSNLYINKQMPAQASLAAGVLQTGMRLSIPVGLAITFAVYGSVAQTPKGMYDRTLPYDRVFLCSIIFAVVSLVFIPFMRIGKQGKRSSTPSIASGSTTAVDERRRGRGTDGAGSKHSDRSTNENSHILAQKPSQESLWSSATAGSFDSYFPRWSWEEHGKWPNDRERHYDDNVVYEVCIKCLQERRVHVQQEKEEQLDQQDMVHEEENVVYDVEARAPHSPINIPIESPTRSIYTGNRESDLRSSGTLPRSAAQFYNSSTNPYRQTIENLSWKPGPIERPPINGYTTHHLPAPPLANKRISSNNPFRRDPPEVRYDNPATGERVLLSGYRSTNVVAYQPTPQLRESTNPYCRDYVDDYQGNPRPMPTFALPPSPKVRSPNYVTSSERTLVERPEVQTSQHNHGSYADARISSFQGNDTTFEFPSSIINGRRTVSGHVRNKSIARDQALSPQPLKFKGREGFTSIELDREAESRHTRESGMSGITGPPRVLNSREMAMHYSAASMMSPRRAERRGGTIINPGGYEPRAMRGISVRAGGVGVQGWI